MRVLHSAPPSYTRSDHTTSRYCRNVFSIFSVWHRLTSLFDARDDPRVPIFQTYMHVTAYVLTIVWAIVRPALTFRSGFNISVKTPLTRADIFVSHVMSWMLIFWI